MTNEMPSKRGVSPNRFDKPWALRIGGKYFGFLFKRRFEDSRRRRKAAMWLAFEREVRLLSNMIVYDRLRTAIDG